MHVAGPKKKRQKPSVPPCAACQHRWGRHSGGIGSCAEAGCACASYVDEARARELERRRAREERDRAEAARWARMTPRERAAETQALLERIARVLGVDWRRRVERPTPRADDGVAPAEALAELGLGLDATAPDVAREFRRRAMATHPDHGGDAEAFKRLVRVRDAALAALEEAT